MNESSNKANAFIIFNMSAQRFALALAVLRRQATI
jgi:hypothetical protein